MPHGSDEPMAMHAAASSPESWQVAVADGGGECDLGNMETLCVPCHLQITLVCSCLGGTVLGAGSLLSSCACPRPLAVLCNLTSKVALERTWIVCVLCHMHVLCACARYGPGQHVCMCACVPVRAMALCACAPVRLCACARYGPGPCIASTLLCVSHGACSLYDRC